MQIIQKGNEHTNYSSRDGHAPACIVDHISAGSMSSMDNWFTSSGNTVSSAHFGVSKAGQIHQYVDIRKMAWANGITSSATTTAPAKIVRDHPGTNPNKYTVSIEHEGTDGNLTEEQYQASVWLHRYIKQQVKEIWGTELLLDPYHVIGHFQIDPVRKASCPGKFFPWVKLYEALKEEDTLNLTKSQRDMLVTALEDLFKRKVITDKSWIDKATRGTLTISEMTWLNLIILSRIDL